MEDLLPFKYLQMWLQATFLSERQDKNSRRPCATWDQGSGEMGNVKHYPALSCSFTRNQTIQFLPQDSPKNKIILVFILSTYSINTYHNVSFDLCNNTARQLTQMLLLLLFPSFSPPYTKLQGLNDHLRVKVLARGNGGS